MNRAKAFKKYFKSGEFYLEDTQGEIVVDCDIDECDDCKFNHNCPVGGKKPFRDKIMKEIREVMPELFL